SDIKCLKEKFTKVDNENMVKESEIVEGGFLDMGFNFFKTKIEIKENTNKDTSLLKVHIEYEVKEEFAANASLVTKETYVNAAKIANEHFAKSKLRFALDCVSSLIAFCRALRFAYLKTIYCVLLRTNSAKIKTALRLV
nr:S-norcoclaurine synthase 2-like [Tanacetum cinerariifolium]